MRLAGIGGANRLDRVGGGGQTLVEGTVDEPATVKVNGEPAQMRPLPGGDAYLYSKELTLGPDERRIIVEAEDGATNRTLKGYTVNIGGVERTLAHELNGNLVIETVAGGKTRKYEWDAINRLTAIQSDATPVSGSWRTEFTYDDGHSRRVRAVEKTWSGNAWTVGSDHRFLWMGTKICQKRYATGATILARYYGEGERRTVGSTNTDYQYTRDHLGSIREDVTTAGSVYLRYDYTPWGERLKIGGTATVAESDAFEWGLTGRHYRAKSSLHLALYRAYEANLGRWLSEDPLGEAGGVILYGYVGNRPLGAWDPLGLCDFNHFSEDDKFNKSWYNFTTYKYTNHRDAAHGVLPKSGSGGKSPYFHVAGHGNSFGMFDDRTAGGGKKGPPIGARDLAKMIKDPKSGWDGKKPIVLHSCETGINTNPIGFAQTLADELGVDFYAPTGKPEMAPTGAYTPTKEWNKFTPGAPHTPVPNFDPMK